MQEPQLSIIIPTYNESQNILKIIKSIKENILDIKTQTIIVDDNSPDGTGKLVDDYISNVKKAAGHTVDIIHRKTKTGLASAVIKGIQHATGDTIVVMDSDFSHPPQIIPKMIESIKQYQCDIVVASRHAKGGAINGWSIKRLIEVFDLYGRKVESSQATTLYTIKNKGMLMISVSYPSGKNNVFKYIENC